MRMKNRWIGGLLLALAVALGACAPPGQGGGSAGEQTEASDAAESQAPASDAAAPGSDDAPAPSYDYDY